MWGIGLGIIQAATPLVFWWLDGSTVYALGLAAIAAIYVGFAVSDGRVKIIAIESGVAFAFVLVGAAAVTGTPWLLVAGFVGHGLKDLWQHHTQFVDNTRWWPPFCMAVGLRRRRRHRRRDRGRLVLPINAAHLARAAGALLARSRVRLARCPRPEHPRQHAPPVYLGDLECGGPETAARNRLPELMLKPGSRDAEPPDPG